jgi:polysaccharide biosynthesis protein PslA
VLFCGGIVFFEAIAMLSAFEAEAIHPQAENPCLLGGLPAARSDPGVADGAAWVAKNLVERAFAILCVVTAAPLILLIAAAILLEGGRPIIFRQARFGKGGAPFDIWKFRTMKTSDCDATGSLQTADDDPRITRVGWFLRRTSLDELPQIWNVIRGEMALVGPRAHPCGMTIDGQLCEEVDLDYHSRHVVRPGLTGWAQVNGSRGALKSPDMLLQRTSLDLHYIQNWSLWLDLRIILRTVWVVLSGQLAR